MRLIKEHGGFSFIFLLCVLLRFIPLFGYQFTFDELSGLDRTQFGSTGEVLEKGVKIDAHPALVQLIIYWLSQTFGYVTWIIKLPFLLCSLGAVLYAYLFGLRFFNKQSGLFAAGIFGFSLVFVFYAPIARMYITGVFFSLGLLYHFYKIVSFPFTTWRDYVGLGFFALLSALNQHVNALFAFTVCLSGCFFLSSKTWKPYLLTCLVTLLFYLPHLPITLYQLSVPGIGRDAGGWLEVPEWTVIFSFLKVLFGTGYLYLFFAAILLYSIIFLRKKIPGVFYLLPFLFLVNFLIIYIYSVVKSPIYQHSVLLFAATGVVLFVSAFFQFENKRVFRLIFPISLLLLLGQSYVIKDYYSNCVKTVYEYQFERTAEAKKNYGDVTALFFDCDTLMRKIYYSKYGSEYELKISSDSIISFGERKFFDTKQLSSVAMFSEYVRNLQTNYLALSSSTPLYEKIVEESFPYLVENTQTQAVYYKLFSKVNPGKLAQPDLVLLEPPRLNAVGKFPIGVDSLNEFPYGVKCPARDVNVTPGAMLIVETVLEAKNKNAGELESVISLTDSTGQTFSYSARQVNDFLIPADSSATLISEHFLGTAFDLHKTEGIINCYLWNKAKGNSIVKEQKVYILDYWHQKWNFWK